MFRIANKRKIFRSEIRTRHRGETSPTLRKGSYIRVSKNYILDVTFNYIFFRFSNDTENQSRLVKLWVKIQYRTMNALYDLRATTVWRM